MCMPLDYRHRAMSLTEIEIKPSIYFYFSLVVYSHQEVNCVIVEMKYLSSFG